MNNTPNIDMGLVESPRVMIFRGVFMDLIEALNLENDQEGVARIVGRPDLLAAAQEVMGCVVFASSQRRFAMVSAELARLEIDKLFCEKDE